MFRIFFALCMCLAVIHLKFRLHRPAHWASFKLAHPEDVQYLQEQGATYRPLGRSGLELKMDATGYACLQNLRDCQALRVRTSIQNLDKAMQGSSSHRQRVVRSHATFAPVDDLDSDSLESLNRQRVDLVLVEIGSRMLTVYEKALTRYEAESVTVL